jgi:hypothetical protein
MSNINTLNLPTTALDVGMHTKSAKFKGAILLVDRIGEKYVLYLVHGLNSGSLDVCNFNIPPSYKMISASLLAFQYKYSSHNTNLHYV